MSSDQELLHAYCHHHDQSAFAQLVERHSAMVQATCRRITGDHHDAEDAAQAAFIVLATKASQLRTGDFLAAWLHRVACYIATRQRAARMRRRRVEVAMSGPCAQAETSNARDPSIIDGARTSMSLEVDEALAMIPVRYRQPLILHYLEDRSCREIASLMAITEDLVASRLSRGRERLRERLRAASTLDVCLTLSVLRLGGVTQPARGMAWPQNPRAQALATSCMRAMWLIPTAIVSSFAAIMLLFALGVAWGSANAHAEDAAHTSVEMPATPLHRQPRLSVALCLPWQERLLVALERRITLHAQNQSALAILESVGSQCGLTMVADLPPERRSLPRITIDARGISLQQVLDQIAQLTNTHYELYAGSLLWRDAKDIGPWDAALPWQRPMNPVVMRLYCLKGLANGTDAQTVMQDIEDHAGIDLFKSGRNPEISGDYLQICASPIDHLAIEAYLSSHWHQTPPEARTSDLPSGMHAKDAQATASMGQASRLDAILGRPLGFELRADRLRAALAEIASATGMVIEFEPSDDDPQLRHRPIPAVLSRLAVRDAIALTLDGTGFHASMRAERSSSARVAIMVISRQPVLSMSMVSYHCSPHDKMPADRPWDPEMLLMAMQKIIAPDSWSIREIIVTPNGAREIHHEHGRESSWGIEAVTVETSGYDVTFTHCLEVQLEIQEQLPLLAAAMRGDPLPAVLTAPPTLELSAPHERPDPSSPAIAQPQDSPVRMRL